MSIELSYVNGQPVGPAQLRFYGMTREQFLALPQEEQAALISAVQQEQHQIAIETADTSAPKKPPSQDERIINGLAGTAGTVGGIYLANQLIGSGAGAAAGGTGGAAAGTAAGASAGASGAAAGGAGAAAGSAPAAPVIVNGATAATSGSSGAAAGGTAGGTAGATSGAGSGILGANGATLGATGVGLAGGAAAAYYAMAASQAYSDLKSKDPHTKDVGGIEAALLATGPFLGWASPIVKPVDKMLRTKHPGQLKRDAMRATLDKQGVIEKQDGKWLIRRPDGTSYDIGTEDRARSDDYEIDNFNADGVGQAIGWMDPIAEILSGGDQGLREQTGGYLTHYVTGSGDVKSNAQDFYKRNGYDRDSMFQLINQMEDMGRIKKDRADAYRNSMNTLWGTGAAPTSGVSASRTNGVMKPIGGSTAAPVPQGGRPPIYKSAEGSTKAMTKNNPALIYGEAGAQPVPGTGPAGWGQPMQQLPATTRPGGQTRQQIDQAYRQLAAGTAAPIVGLRKPTQKKPDQAAQQMTAMIDSATAVPIAAFDPRGAAGAAAAGAATQAPMPMAMPIMNRGIPRQQMAFPGYYQIPANKGPAQHDMYRNVARAFA